MYIRISSFFLFLFILTHISCSNTNPDDHKKDIIANDSSSFEDANYDVQPNNNHGTTEGDKNSDNDSDNTDKVLYDTVENDMKVMVDTVPNAFLPVDRVFYGSKIEEDKTLYKEYHSEDKKYYPKMYVETDCIYGPTNPHMTADNIPEMKSYTINEWDGIVKMLLNSGDSLYVEKIACRYYRNEGILIKYNDTHSLKDLQYWLNEAKWISERINKKYIHNDLVNRLNSNEYGIDISEKYISINLLQTKSHQEIKYWWINISKDIEDVRITTGYSY